MSNVTGKEIKEAFLGQDLRKEKHPMPGTSMEVWVHELSSYDLETWREICRAEDDNMRRLNAAKLLQLSLRDERGNRIFDEEEIAIIGGKPAHLIEPLAKAVLRLSGYGVEASEAILKNFRKILGAVGLLDSLESSTAASASSTADIPPTSSGSNGSPSSSGPVETPPKDSKPS